MAKYEYIQAKYSIVNDYRICTLTISNPQSLNSLSTMVLAEIGHFISERIKEADIAVLVITGDGDKSFVAGADIVEMSKLNKKEAVRFAKIGCHVFQTIEDAPFPVIAAVNGYALGGGCELAMACDIRIAADTAKFAQPEVGLGIIPGFFGNYRLSRLVGIGRAKELIFTGRIVKAQEALEMGLVNMVVPKQDLMKAVTEFLEQMLNNDTHAIMRAKLVINKACSGFSGYADDYSDICSDVEEQTAVENEIFADCFSRSGNAKKRMKQFLENQTKKNSNKEKK
ncbi:MAG: enoyl-CoA hydratase/isomerase family protein [Bacteroidales bacterium]|nr:enoyl-CoA hydratase/isomerase family protein [Bacteroidales bacterium]